MKDGPRAQLKELQHQVKTEGATKTARDVVAALKAEPKYGDQFTLSDLAYSLITERGNEKAPVGESFVRDVTADVTAVDSTQFSNVSGQVFLNALTTRYNAADLTLKGLFRRIPSTLVDGERFGGISNISTFTAPISRGGSLPWVSPSEDYTLAPGQRWFGGIVGLDRPMVWMDRTGEVKYIYEKLGEALGQTEELEAASTLSGIDSNSTSGASYSRTQYNWKRTTYATYQSSTPWINLQTGNGLVDWNNVNTSYLLLAEMTDPFTGLPLSRMGNTLTLIVPQDLTFVAERIKHTLEFRTGTASTSNSILLSGGPGSTFNQQELKIVESRYLRKVLADNGLATTTWFMGYPEEAFSWQYAMSIEKFDAVPNTGELFTRSLVSAHKVEYWNTSFVFNPRYVVKTTA